MRKCKQCGHEKTEPNFRLWARGRKSVCIQCESLPSAAKPEAPPVATSKGDPLIASFSVPANGLGFDLKLYEGRFVLSQDKPDPDNPGMVYTHEIDLLPHEASSMVDQVATLIELHQRPNAV